VNDPPEKAYYRYVENRPCGYCGEHNTVEGHDACLGILPGMMNACCRHGNTKDSYIQFDEESVVCGSAAVEIMEIIKIQKI